MLLRDLLLPEWDVECGSIRRVLERVPEARLDRKTHAHA